MSVFDKMFGAVTPPESEEDRAQARRKIQGLAEPGDWLSQIIRHHEMVEQAFGSVRAATDPQTRVTGMKRLALLLNGHSMAEEAVIYPVMAQTGEKAHAGMAYTEQATAKMQMAELENIDPADEAFVDKLEHIRGAVLHHVYEEESGWFPALKRDASPELQQRMSRKYSEETERYFGREGGADDSVSSQSTVSQPAMSPDVEPRSFGQHP